MVVQKFELLEELGSVGGGEDVQVLHELLGGGW